MRSLVFTLVLYNLSIPAYLHDGSEYTGNYQGESRDLHPQCIVLQMPQIMI